jgi:hypothetical protein
MFWPRQIALIEREPFLNEQMQAPAVTDHVMLSPNEVVRVVFDLDQCGSHQRSLRQIEAASFIRIEICIELRALFRLGKPDPAEPLEI